MRLIQPVIPTRVGIQTSPLLRLCPDFYRDAGAGMTILAVGALFS